MAGDVALMSFAGLVMAVMLTVELLRRVSRSTAQNIRATRTLVLCSPLTLNYEDKMSALT